MLLEFGYNKATNELIVFKNGDDVAYVDMELDDDELETIKYELENSGTYFGIYDDY